MESTRKTLDLSKSKHQAERIGSDDARFLASFAHELRTPAAVISYSVNHLLSLDCVDDLVGGIYKRLLRQSKHLNFLVDTVMDCSCIDCGQLMLRKERVDIAEVIFQAIEMTQPIIDAQRHHVEVAGMTGKFYLEADPARLLQIFTNLLQNAAKYTPEAGRIDVSVCLDDENVVVRVKDNGIGIDGDLLPKIFDFFTRADEARAMNQGAGIGLALVSRLVKSHDGKIEALSNGKGHGSEFIVSLPCLA